MVKLLYITNGIHGSGGLERVLSIKASYLAEHYNYDITILSLNDLKEPFYQFSPKIKFVSIDVSGNPLAYFLKYKRGIRDIIKSFKPDIISVCDDGLKGFILPQILKSKPPIIYERHASVSLNFNTANKGFFQKLKNKFTYFLMRWAATKFDKFVVLTNGNLKEWKDGNLEVIPNPLSFYPKELLQKTKLPKTILAVGSHSYNKGYDLLLQSWKKVNEQFPDWKLMIYGKKNPECKLVELSNQLRISSSVTFNDPIPNIEEAYAKAAMLVLPSRSEGFGMVLIEAMAYGLPCISYDCPHGPGDIITNGEDGYLIENGNVDEFANRIIGLIQNPENLLQIGVKARRNVKRYLPEHIVDQWDKLFKTLLV
ncbi:glycosyltransferase family 4 protein [Aequorivita xiaoshiensis]|uniref:Glycosyltransferase family 4 protein n=1 Tax=Aequorivita xiaoshiensis TaxID=2874476 RepID=A0A9X1QZT6_9FLAO|nr:glycosyltransferase family 4 protein [Aequorivita xiaoshiensis]MCG2431691.1 glycosyltransferase family 4 protein [Aequorivita xiaoshiensis]